MTLVLAWDFFKVKVDTLLYIVQQYMEWISALQYFYDKYHARMAAYISKLSGRIKCNNTLTSSNKATCDSIEQVSSTIVNSFSYKKPSCS